MQVISAVIGNREMHLSCMKLQVTLAAIDPCMQHQVTYG
jgi:hypothetical protein